MRRTVATITCIALASTNSLPGVEAVATASSVALRGGASGRASQTARGQTVNTLMGFAGGSKGGSSSEETPNGNAPDPAAVELGRALQASAAYGQPVAHPVNSFWNPLNQDHTPQAATNQVLPIAYNAGATQPENNLAGRSFGAEYSLAETAASTRSKEDTQKNTALAKNMALAKEEDAENNPQTLSGDTSISMDGSSSMGSTGSSSSNDAVSMSTSEKVPLVSSTLAEDGAASATPYASVDEYQAGGLTTRGQPVANPNILAGVSVVQHPSLDGLSQGAHENPFKVFSPDAASFGTNPLAYHPDAQVQHPSRVGAAAVAQTSSPPVAFGNYAGGNVAYNPAVATTIGAQRAHNYLIRSAFNPRQGEQAPYPAVPWHASPSLLHSAAGASAAYHPEPLANPWTDAAAVSASQNVLLETRVASRPSGHVGSHKQALSVSSLLEQAANGAKPQSASGAKSSNTNQASAGSGAMYDGNYIKQWPPPEGSNPASIMMPLGVAPAVPPPAPPTVGMAPPPPPASHILDTPDVLPQPTPPVMATDARWGTKMFPTQSDTVGSSVPSLDPRTSSDIPSEEFENTPLMTPLGRENTIEGGTN